MFVPTPRSTRVETGRFVFPGQSNAFETAHGGTLLKWMELPYRSRNLSAVLARLVHGEPELDGTSVSVPELTVDTEEDGRPLASEHDD